MHCNIIEDLLPLYAEDLCSAESRAAVEAHVSGCEACREKLARLHAGLSDAAPADDTGAGALKKVKRGILARNLLLAGGLLLVLGVGLAVAAAALYRHEIENLYMTIFLFLIPFVLFCVSSLAGLAGKKRWIALPAALVVPLIVFGRHWDLAIPLGVALLLAGYLWGFGVQRALRKNRFPRFRRRLWIALAVLGMICIGIAAVAGVLPAFTYLFIPLFVLLLPMLFYGAAFQLCYPARGLKQTGLVFACMAAACGVIAAICLPLIHYFEPFELVYALLPAFAGGLTGILTAQREEEGRNAAL